MNPQKKQLLIQRGVVLGVCFVFGASAFALVAMKKSRIDTLDPGLDSLERARSKTQETAIAKNALSDQATLDLLSAAAVSGAATPAAGAAAAPSPTPAQPGEALTQATVPSTGVVPTQSVSPTTTQAAAPSSAPAASPTTTQASPDNPLGLPTNLPPSNLPAVAPETGGPDRRPTGPDETRARLQNAAYTQLNQYSAQTGQPTAEAAPVVNSEQGASTQAGTAQAPVAAPEVPRSDLDILLALNSDKPNVTKQGRSMGSSGQKILAGTHALCRMEHTLLVLPGEKQDTSVTCLGAEGTDAFPGGVRLIGQAALNKNMQRVEITFQKCVLPINNYKEISCSGSVRDVLGRTGLTGRIENPAYWSAVVSGLTKHLIGTEFRDTLSSSTAALSGAQTVQLSSTITQVIGSLGDAVIAENNLEGRSIEIAGGAMVKVFFPTSSDPW